MNLSDRDKILHRKLSLIESVNDQLRNIYSIQHIRNRSIEGSLSLIKVIFCWFPYWLLILIYNLYLNV